MVVAFSPTGSELWTANWASTMISARAITVDPSGNVIIGFQCYGGGGNIDLDPGAGTNNRSCSADFNTNGTALVKLNASGIHQWGYIIGAPAAGPGGYQLRGIGTSSDGSVWTAGYASNTVGVMDIDPGAGTQNIPALSTSTALLFVKYSSAGAYVTHQLFGNALNQGGQFTSLVVTPSDGIIVTGVASTGGTAVDMEPGAGTTNVTFPINSFWASYSSTGTLNWVRAMSNNGSAPEGLSMSPGASEFLLGGRATLAVDIDPSGSTSNVTMGSGTQGTTYYATYSVATGALVGSPIQIQSVGGVGVDGVSTACHTNDGLYVIACGYFFSGGAGSGNALDFDPSAGTDLMYRPAGQGGKATPFCAKFSRSSGAVVSKKMMPDAAANYFVKAVACAPGGVVLVGAVNPAVQTVDIGFVGGPYPYSFGTTGGHVAQLPDSAF